jgi:hypothetical protein
MHRLTDQSRTQSARKNEKYSISEFFGTRPTVATTVMEIQTHSRRPISAENELQKFGPNGSSAQVPKIASKVARAVHFGVLPSPSLFDVFTDAQ